MQRVIAIFFLFLSILGCSSSRKAIESTSTLSNDYIKTISDLAKLNISSKDFDIQKIEVSFKNIQGEESFIANLKFRAPNEYLISVRTKIGIEVARINLTQDSIFVIDKINNVLYKGANSFLQDKYGLSLNFMPLLVGDVLVNREEGANPFKCNTNSNFASKINSSLINYSIYCEKAKPRMITVVDSNNKTSILTFSYQKDFNQLFVPEKVRVFSEYYGYEINLILSNYSFGTSTKIIFDTNDIDKNVILK